MLNFLKTFGIVLKYSGQIKLVLTIIGLLQKTLETLKPGEVPNVAEISKIIYALLPAELKKDGTQAEFVDFIFHVCSAYNAGVAFLKP